MTMSPLLYLHDRPLEFLEPQETRLGADNKIYELPASKTLEADPFDVWFKGEQP